MTKSPSGSASKSRDRLLSVLLNPLPQRVERAIPECVDDGRFANLPRRRPVAD